MNVFGEKHILYTIPIVSKINRITNKTQMTMYFLRRLYDSVVVEIEQTDALVQLRHPEGQATQLPPLT